MRAIILTEIGEKIGFGHFYRCLSIYEELQKRRIKSTFVLNSDNAGEQYLHNKDFVFFDWIKDDKKLRQILKKGYLAIVDSYLAPLSTYEYISNNVALSVYIDDNNRLTYPKGIVVNGNIYASCLKYNKKGAEYLLGTKFVPLRKGFIETKLKLIRDAIENILITFGGSDVGNITPKILRAICYSYPKVDKNIIIGHAFKNTEEIFSLADTRTTFISSPTETQLKKLMQNADIAISAGGQTLYELLRMGVPTIAIPVAENQILNVKSLHKTGVVVGLEIGKIKKIEKPLSAVIAQLKDPAIRRKMSQSGKELVDGKGSVRIVDISLKRLLEKTVTLRKVCQKDMIGVFDLSNQSNIRSASFQQKKIHLDNHKKWFKEKLSNTTCYFFVAEFEKRIIGQLRLDVENHAALISIGVSQEFSGMGIGKLLITYALDFIRFRKIKIQEIVALIKINNHVSRGFFEKSGFKFRRTLLVNSQKTDEFFYTI